ncbi:MAG: hypothetical protein Q4F10_03210 [Corynebacterium glutamicum]|uniref:hypothetical protein n=1 Tax=Corynebacterium glutamicum TaxID=1718 RepID=UPI00097A939B|nr:hypothetical protein [Corynebacterium glutamicum]MDO5372435.1 hypothetical protein [Corynebacterium glutamicum]GAV98548.1 hypothetical protein CS176_2778 [Corynebacterium glutamicum]SJM70894.1 hypothetical protein FM102_14300 [Corynebacterium glutamicum]
MSKTIIVRTEIEIPGHPTAIHIAEMQELPASESQDGVQMCKMQRIIELAGTTEGDVVTGAGVIGGSNFQLNNEPNEVVPHPDTYADFPDIKAVVISAETFEGLWLEAGAKFPGLN